MMTAQENTYVLITPARNEEAYIEKTIQSVISQTVLPEKWIIISDGSTDRTDEIVQKYARTHEFIQLLSRSSDRERDFSSKVIAFNAGYSLLKDTQYEFIGNLDADVSVEPEYFGDLLKKFSRNDRLGIGGGWIYERENGKWCECFGNTERDVPGAVMLFRRKCFEDTGGYIPLKNGGEDTLAEVVARMNGWEAESFTDLKVLHYRNIGSGAGNILFGRIRQGAQEYSLGSHPLYLLAKFIYRLIEKPYVLGSLCRFIGYCRAFLSREKRIVQDDVVRYIRREEMARLKSLLRRILAIPGRKEELTG